MNLEDKVDKLKNEAIALRKEMVVMKTLVKQQNDLIKSLLEKTQADAEAQSQTKIRNWFPIRTQKMLDEFEKAVDHTNREAIIRQVRICMERKGLSDTLGKILDDQLIVKYNLEGNYNKRRLFDYENLLDVLYRVTQIDGWDHDKFLKEFRKGMRKIKVRQCKKNERTRNKRKQERLTKSNGFKENDSTSNDTEDGDDDDDDDDDGDGDDDSDDDGDDDDLQTK